MIRPTKDGEVFTLENGNKVKAVKIDNAVCEDCCFSEDYVHRCSRLTLDIHCSVWNSNNRTFSHYKFVNINEESN